MKVLLCVALLLVIAVVIEAKGSRGGSSSTSRSSSRSSSRSTSRGTRYYSRSSYSKSSVLTYMTLATYYSYSFNNARYYRYPKNDPEYCLVCNETVSNDTCADQKLVCTQSSDCFYSTYLNSSGHQLIGKGCLYDPYGNEGCEEVVKNCTALGRTECKCNNCTEPYCNKVGETTYSSVVIILGGIFSYVLTKVAC